MVIGDLSHVFALDVSPIRGQALASPPFRQRAATQNVFRHGKDLGNRHGKGSLVNALLVYDKYRASNGRNMALLHGIVCYGMNPAERL